MRKLVNTILCVVFTVAAFAMFIALFEGKGGFWHAVMCVIFACSSVAFSGRLTRDDRYRRVS